MYKKPCTLDYQCGNDEYCQGELCAPRCDPALYSEICGDGSKCILGVCSQNCEVNS